MPLLRLGPVRPDVPDQLHREIFGDQADFTGRPAGAGRASREILNAQFLIGSDTAGGSRSNIWQGSADLLVVPELA